MVQTISQNIIMPGMHTGSASNGLPNRGANDSIKRLLTSISETASKIFNKKQLHDEFML